MLINDTKRGKKVLQKRMDPESLIDSKTIISGYFCKFPASDRYLFRSCWEGGKSSPPGTVIVTHKERKYLAVLDSRFSNNFSTEFMRKIPFDPRWEDDPEGIAAGKKAERKLKNAIDMILYSLDLSEYAWEKRTIFKGEVADRVGKACYGCSDSDSDHPSAEFSSDEEYTSYYWN